MPEKVPPFIDGEPRPVVPRVEQSFRDNLTTGGGWALLTLALLAGAKLTYDHLTISPKPENYSLSAPLLIICIAYLFGWVLAFISIRRMHNQVMPLVIKIYSYSVLGGILLIYARVLYKLLVFPKGGEAKLLPSNSHFLLLFVGAAVLITLSLLVRNFYLRPHAIILLIAIGAHIVLAVYRYVFLGVSWSGLVGYDIRYMIVVAGIALFLAFPQVLTWMLKPQPIENA